MHEAIKAATGIDASNCLTCHHLATEGDGPEYNGTWYVCAKIDRMSNLKPFPFKKEMPCWEANFWCSKFTDLIKAGEQEEALSAIEEFNSAIDAALKTPTPAESAESGAVK